MPPKNRFKVYEDISAPSNRKPDKNLQLINVKNTNKSPLRNISNNQYLGKKSKQKLKPLNNKRANIKQNLEHIFDEDEESDYIHQNELNDFKATSTPHTSILESFESNKVDQIQRELRLSNEISKIHDSMDLNSKTLDLKKPIVEENSLVQRRTINCIPEDSERDDLDLEEDETNKDERKVKDYLDKPRKSKLSKHKHVPSKRTKCQSHGSTNFKKSRIVVASLVDKSEGITATQNEGKDRTPKSQTRAKYKQGRKDNYSYIKDKIGVNEEEVPDELPLSQIPVKPKIQRTSTLSKSGEKLRNCNKTTKTKENPKKGKSEESKNNTLDDQPARNNVCLEQKKIGNSNQANKKSSKKTNITAKHVVENQYSDDEIIFDNNPLKDSEAIIDKHDFFGVGRNNKHNERVSKEKIIEIDGVATLSAETNKTGKKQNSASQNAVKPHNKITTKDFNVKLLEKNPEHEQSRNSKTSPSSGTTNKLYGQSKVKKHPSALVNRKSVAKSSNEPNKLKKSVIQPCSVPTIAIKKSDKVKDLQNLKNARLVSSSQSSITDTARKPKTSTFKNSHTIKLNKKNKITHTNRVHFNFTSNKNSHRANKGKMLTGKELLSLCVKGKDPIDLLTERKA